MAASACGRCWPVSVSNSARPKGNPGCRGPSDPRAAVVPTSTAAFPFGKGIKMTSSFSKTAGRSLALVTLVGASLTVGLFSQASAQTTVAPTDSTKAPAAQAATSNKVETVEQRITTLKAALKVTPDQESKWDGVANAMRENAASMDKLIQEK